MGEITVPTLPPLMAIVNGRYTYVCAYSDSKDPVTKKNSRYSTTVGKIVGGGNEGLIEWYDNFVEQYPALSFFKCYRKKLDVRSGRNFYKLCFVPIDEAQDQAEDA